MRIEGLDLPRVLGGLKDFQRRTVDYVFQRLYLDPEPAHRFLIADEVGLGKTMVARGLIARTLEHLRDKADRIDIVYVCSNAAIAQQNVNRLNVLGERHFAIASRLTLLPAQLSSLTANRVNFVSFTPGTTFDLGRKGGTWSERILLFRMLCPVLPDATTGLTNVLQATVGTERWRDQIRQSTAPIDPALEEKFRARLRIRRDLLNRVAEACEIFHRQRQNWPKEIHRSRMSLIGELRQLLAQVCVDALEPDLVILDEFQRFKDLLHGESEAAELAGSLMKYRDPDGNPVRVVLLSATPYRPLTTDDDADDNHYRDFIQTLRFLFDKPEQVEMLEDRLRIYRRCLFGADGVAAAAGEVRDAVEAQLRSVMVRTERVGSTARLDAMVSTPGISAPVRPADLRQARAMGQVAEAVGAGDQTEYWKSAPYVIHFMKDYELRRRLEDVIASPPAKLIDAVAAADDVMLRRRRVRHYEQLDACNGRLRKLIEETLDRDMWSMLWLPPSLQYVETGAGQDRTSLTKALVFSSWNVVPDAIAALLSYEAERRLVAGESDRPVYQGLTRKYGPLLRFAVSAGSETGMGALALLYPCVTLAEIVDPLAAAVQHGGPVSAGELKRSASESVRSALAETGVWPGAGGIDPRWYWAALPLLDRGNHPVTEGWMLGRAEWQSAIADDEAGRALLRHIHRFAKTSGDDLGAAPDDLVDVLADLALGSPAIVALRALGRLVPEKLAATVNLQAAATIAAGFRTLYNLPESILLLRGSDEEAYWRRVAAYGAEHDLQAVMDEYVHVLRESLGLISSSSAEVVTQISAEVASAVSIRTSRVDADEIQTRAGARRVRTRRFSIRCRFALRFSELKDDDGATLARSGAVQKAFNSPFRPFVLASTSIGQEGLDFHQYCHAIYHWNLPSNPVDMEQREGRVHRYKGHAVRKNVAKRFGLPNVPHGEGNGRAGAVLRADPWSHLFERARADRQAHESDLVPYWVYPVEGGWSIERRVPILPFSKEVQRFRQLQRRLAVYRLVFGQPRQEDLMAYLEAHALPSGADARDWRISLEPPEISLEEYDRMRANLGLTAAPDLQPARAMEELPAGPPTALAAAAFHDAAIQNYLAGLLTVDDARAVERALDFAVHHAADLGWLEAPVPSIRPVFPSLSSRPLFGLNSRGELTLLLGQINLSTEERRFVEEWKAELEELFDTSWPGYSRILRPADWTSRVDAVIDTIAWRLELRGL